MYNEEGGEIIAFCERNSIPLFKGLDMMTLADYRDGIHVNEKGQKVIAEYLNRCIEEIYKKK